MYLKTVRLQKQKLGELKKALGLGLRPAGSGMGSGSLIPVDPEDSTRFHNNHPPATTSSAPSVAVIIPGYVVVTPGCLAQGSEVLRSPNSLKAHLYPGPHSLPSLPPARLANSIWISVWLTSPTLPRSRRALSGCNARPEILSSAQPDQSSTNFLCYPTI